MCHEDAIFNAMAASTPDMELVCERFRLSNIATVTGKLPMNDTVHHTGGAAAARCGSKRRPSRIMSAIAIARDCRRATGAPVSAFVGFMADAVIMRGDALGTLREWPGDAQFLRHLRFADRLCRHAASATASISCSARWTRRQSTGRRMHAYRARAASLRPYAGRPAAPLSEPACPDLTERHHETHPLLAERSSRDRRLARPRSSSG